MRRSLLIVSATTLAIGLTACASSVPGTASRATLALSAPGSTTASAPDAATTATTSSSPQPPTSTSTTASSASSTTASSPAENASLDYEVDELKFGQDFEWEDGLVLSISTPTAFTPGSDADYLPAPAYAGVTVTVTNHTGADYTFDDFYLAGLSGGIDMAPVWDSAELLGAPVRNLHDDASVSFAAGFSVADLNDIVLDVSPGLDYYDVYFTATGDLASTGAADPAIGPVVKEADGVQPAFGETFEWTDGLRITVAEPTTFTPGPDSDAPSAAGYVSFTVTVVNGTDSLYEEYSLEANVRSGGTTSEQVHDYANGYVGTPYTGLFVGRTATFQLGFAVADPTDVTLQLSPDGDYFNAVFTG